MDYIIEPIIGAIIGCFTNYIAIKMLFRPFEEKRIFGKKVPFTPGIIPKRKSEIAKAIGTVVDRDLIDKKQITNILLGENITNKVVQNVMDYTVYIPDDVNDGRTIGIFAAEIVSKLNIGEIASNEIYNYINQKISGTFASGFISDKLITNISDGIGEKLQQYVETNGKNVVATAIDEQMHKLSGLTIKEILMKYDIDTNYVEECISSKYKKTIQEKSMMILDNINILQMVQDKINDMDMVEFEKLIFSIMKKELNSIVYLGAAIGFIIGIINIVI